MRKTIFLMVMVGVSGCNYKDYTDAPVDETKNSSSTSSSEVVQKKDDNNGHHGDGNQGNGQGNQSEASPSPTVVAVEPQEEPSPVSTDWRDYHTAFNCGMTYQGSTVSFPEDYERIAQPVVVNEAKIQGVITAYAYPSGQTIEVYNSLNGMPNELLASTVVYNPYNPGSSNGEMCCSDRTFAWYFDKEIDTIPGDTYHFVIKPLIPSERTSVKRAWITNSCFQLEQVKCQKDGSWFNCGGTTGNAPEHFVQDILYQ
jgi:hypothetical protein